VAGQIIPWNFPLLMAAWKIAPALAAGNTVVLKPAETTPLTAMKLAEIFRRPSCRTGVVNLVNGFGKTGAALVEHPGVDKIAFTGSTDVGKRIQRALAGTTSASRWSSAARAPTSSSPTPPSTRRSRASWNGIFFNQGHVCCAGSRLLVEESVAKRSWPSSATASRRCGSAIPLDKNTDIGAINSRAQLQKIQELVDSGVAEGAMIHQSKCAVPDKGFYFRPTFFTGVSQSHRIAQEEIFGPVLSVLTFRTPEEAIEKANNTAYGLSAGIWTDKGSKLFQVAGALKAGVIWGNSFNKFDPGSPFGGYKESGFGREGGWHGLLPYLEVR
jgi:aldehyde dehydrogenase (NAD+)